MLRNFTRWFKFGSNVPLELNRLEKDVHDTLSAVISRLQRIPSVVVNVDNQTYQARPGDIVLGSDCTVQLPESFKQGGVVIRRTSGDVEVVGRGDTALNETLDGTTGNNMRRYEWDGSQFVLLWSE